MLIKPLVFFLIVFSHTARAELSEFSKTFKKLLQDKELVDQNGEHRLHGALIRTCDIYHMDVRINQSSSSKLATFYLEQAGDKILLKIIKGQKISYELEVIEFNKSSFYAEGEDKDQLRVFTCRLKGVQTFCEEWLEMNSQPLFAYKYFSESLN